MKALSWEPLKTQKAPFSVMRAKVPGGWLLAIYDYNIPPKCVGITFYPDPQHTWDGSSLD